MRTSQVTRMLAALGGAAALALGVASARAGNEPAQAQVVEVRGRGVVKLSQGSEGGVKARQVFEIYGESKAYSLPLSGGAARLRVNRSVVARAVVFSVDPKSSLARTYEEKGKVEANQVCVVNPTLVPPELAPHVRGCSPTGAQASVPWHKQVLVSVDAEIEPGRTAYYEWRAEEGGTFTRGVEVSPGVFRTTSPENFWIAPYAKKTYQTTVKVTDSTGKFEIHPIPLTSTGPASKGSSPRVQRTLFAKTKFEGLRDIGLDHKNNLFWLDGTPGIRADEFLHGVNADGVDLGVATVVGHDFAALAISDEAFFFLDLKDKSVKRYPRGGPLADLLRGESQKIGEKGDGNGRFSDPIDMALGPDGALYVLDAGSRAVHRFDADGRFAYSFGVGGEGERQLKAPVGLAVSDDGTVYVLDNGRKKVVIYRDGRATDDMDVGTPAEDLRGIAVDVYGPTINVLERSQGAIKRFGPKGEPLPPAGSKDPDDVAAMKKATRIRSDSARLLYVIDHDATAMARYDAAGGDFVARTGDFELSKELRITAAADGDVTVLDKDKYAAYRLDRRGWITARMGGEGKDMGQLRTPVGIGSDADGQVYVADAKKVEIEKYSPKGGSFLKSFGNEAVFHKIRCLQMSSQREKLIVLQAGDEVQLGVVNPATGEREANLTPSGVEFDDLELATFAGRFDPAAPKSEEGWYWIVDKAGRRAHVIPLGDRRPTEVATEFQKVTGIAATVAGVVFLSDAKTRTIEVFNMNGQKLGTIADAADEPWDVAADDLGFVYVFDKGHDGRIIELGE
jgi:streptogramin lyase